MEGELGMRIWGGVFQPSMYDMRVGVDSNNSALSAMSWEGGKNSSSLTTGPQGGGEMSWGILPDVRFLLAGEARGVANKGAFKGTGANLGGTASRNLYMSSYGGEAGLSVLLREFGERARGLLTARAGVHVLSGSRDSWSEEGPGGKFSSTSSLSGTGLGAMVGLEWEMSFASRDGSIAPGVFLLAGYRFLTFSRVDYRYHDSAGTKDAGSVRDSAGDRMSVDMSGPEFRLGLLLAMPTKPQ